MVTIKILCIKNETFWYYVGNDLSELTEDDPDFEDDEDEFATQRDVLRAEATVSFRQLIEQNKILFYRSFHVRTLVCND